MNNLKKYLGLVWMVMGPLAIYYLVRTAMAEVAKKPNMDTRIQWGVFVVVFIPIAIGLVIFGWYAFKGKYEHLPESSREIND